MMKATEAKDVRLGKHIIGFGPNQDIREAFIRKCYGIELKKRISAATDVPKKSDK